MKKLILIAIFGLFVASSATTFANTVIEVKAPVMQVDDDKEAKDAEKKEEKKCDKSCEKSCCEKKASSCSDKK